MPHEEPTGEVHLPLNNYARYQRCEYIDTTKQPGESGYSTRYVAVQTQGGHHIGGVVVFEYESATRTWKEVLAPGMAKAFELGDFYALSDGRLFLECKAEAVPGEPKRRTYQWLIRSREA